MEINIKGTPKEIAALALELQERHRGECEASTLPQEVHIGVSKKDVINSVFAAIHDMSEGNT